MSDCVSPFFTKCLRVFLFSICIVILWLSSQIHFNRTERYSDKASLAFDMAQGVFRATDVSESGPTGPKYEVYNCKTYLHKKPGSLPDFLVAGVHKGGSTALFGYLSQHGSIYPSACKEVNFFSRDELWSKGLHFYRRHFHDLSNTPGVITGEGTPNYIRNPTATLRIAKSLPNVSVLVALRDPTERFISQYVGFVDRKLTKLSCDEYWEKELEEINMCVSTYKKESYEPSPTNIGLNEAEALNVVASGSKLYRDPLERKPPSSCEEDDQSCVYRYCLSVLHENAISRGVYVDQLVRWLHFYPAKQILPLQSETLQGSTAETMQKVVSFLGLRMYNAKELEAFHKTRVGSSHHANPLSQQCDRSRIRSYYAKDNRILYDVLKAQWPEVGDQWSIWES